MTDFPDVGAAASRELARAALRNSIEARRANPLRYGTQPHAMQVQFLSSPARRKIVLAANRVGKTFGAMTDVLYLARGEHPFRPSRICSTIWVGSPDYPSYLRFHKPTFDELCPPAWLIQYHESEKWADIRRVDGGVCRVSFLSYDMERSKWQGAGVDHIWLDEEPPEDIFGEALARVVTTRGSVVLTFTPVEGVGWWDDRIWRPATAGKSAWRPFQWALATFDEENDADFNVGESLVPHLTREQIVEFASNYPDEEERAIRVFGQVRSRKGLVYKQFTRDVHLVPRFPVPPHWHLWGAVDPGYHGFAVTLAAQAVGGYSFVVQEYFSQQETTAERFRQVMERVRQVRTPDELEGVENPFFRVRHAPDIDPVVVPIFVDTEDPQVVLELNVIAGRVQAEDAAAGKPPVILAFASLDQGLKARKAGILRVQQMLKADPANPTPREVVRPRPVAGEPEMYFFDDLCSDWQGADKHYVESRLFWEIERYSWKKPPRGSTVARDDGDENSAAGAHQMATLRYLVMARMGPPDTPQQKVVGSEDSATRAAWADIEELEQRMEVG